jgi:hypothetical protein
VDGSPFKELADKHHMHDRANSSGQRAARLYQEAFSHRRHPNRKTFKPPPVSREREESVQTPNVEEPVFGRVEENPGVSTRQVATDVEEMTLWRMLHEQCL